MSEPTILERLRAREDELLNEQCAHAAENCPAMEEPIEEADDLPRVNLTLPWSTLNLMPYRNHHLVDAPPEVFRAVVEAHAWTDRELRLVHCHLSEEAVCFKCAAAVVAALPAGAISTELVAKYAGQVSDDGRVRTFFHPKADLRIRYLIQDGNRVQFFCDPCGPQKGKKRFGFQMAAADLSYATGRVKVKSPGQAEALLVDGVKAEDISYMEVWGL